MSGHLPIIGRAQPAPVWTCCVAGCRASVRFLLPANDGDIRPEFRERPVCFRHCTQAYWPDVLTERQRRRTPSPAKGMTHRTWLRGFSALGPVEVLMQLATEQAVRRPSAESMLRRRVQTLCLLWTAGESTLEDVEENARRHDFTFLGGAGLMTRERRRCPNGRRRYHYRLTKAGQALARQLVSHRSKEAA